MLFFFRPTTQKQNAHEGALGLVSESGFDCNLHHLSNRIRSRGSQALPLARECRNSTEKTKAGSPGLTLTAAYTIYRIGFVPGAHKPRRGPGRAATQPKNSRPDFVSLSSPNLAALRDKPNIEKYRQPQIRAGNRRFSNEHGHPDRPPGPSVVGGPRTNLIKC